MQVWDRHVPPILKRQRKSNFPRLSLHPEKKKIKKIEVLTRGQAAGFMNPTRRPASRTGEQKKTATCFQAPPLPKDR